MKYLLLILFLFLMSCSTKVVFSPGVNKVTSNISENVQTEIAVCLRYTKIGKIIYVHNYYIPFIHKSSQTSVVARNCPPKYKMMWHNHPVSGFKKDFIQYLLKVHDIKIDHAVYLSRVDTQMKEQYEYVIVASDKRWAWWHKDQVKVNDDTIIFKPIEGQIHEW